MIFSPEASIEPETKLSSRHPVMNTLIKGYNTQTYRHVGGYSDPFHDTISVYLISLIKFTRPPSSCRTQTSSVVMMFPTLR
jgi:hypothetical protein